jgi:predicted  nucleic acid-binding Zn-ribbon protein
LLIVLVSYKFIKVTLAKPQHTVTDPSTASLDPPTLDLPSSSASRQKLTKNDIDALYDKIKGRLPSTLSTITDARCKADILSIKNDVDSVLHTLNTDMASLKTTLEKQSGDVDDVKDKLRKQGLIILDMQNDFKATMHDILTQVHLLSSNNSPSTSQLGAPHIPS